MWMEESRRFGSPKTQEKCVAAGGCGWWPRLPLSEPVAHACLEGSILTKGTLPDDLVRHVISRF